MNRCISLNNPMSIERNPIPWKGESTMQDDHTFVRFETPELGLRAGMKTLLTYQHKYDIEHIQGMINRFAPPSENNTEAYIDDVCAHCGVGRTDFYDLTFIGNLILLAKAIVRHEQGACPDPTLPYWYDNSVYDTAAKDALV